MKYFFPYFFLVSLLSKGQSLETVIQKGHELAVIAVAVSPDSNYVATGSHDKTAKLWVMDYSPTYLLKECREPPMAHPKMAK